MQDWYRLTLVVLQAKCNRSTRPIIHLSGPLDDHKRDHMLSGCPSTRWTRFRSPEKPGYPVASTSPTSRIWRVPVRGGYPFVAGTQRVAPLVQHELQRLITRKHSRQKKTTGIKKKYAQTYYSRVSSLLISLLPLLYCHIGYTFDFSIVMSTARVGGPVNSSL